VSAQTLNIMLVDLFRSEEKLEQYAKDPDQFTAQYEVTAEERERLKTKDMGWLYQHGVHPYILVQYSFAIKHDLGQYLQQLKSATGT
jgi:hypothetical protein